jgi:hypothetical protein
MLLSERRQRKRAKSKAAELRKFVRKPEPPDRGTFLRMRADFIFILRRLAVLNQHQEKHRQEIPKLEIEHNEILLRSPIICDGVRVGDVAPTRLEI